MRAGAEGQEALLRSMPRSRAAGASKSMAKRCEATAIGRAYGQCRNASLCCLPGSGARQDSSPKSEADLQRCARLFQTAALRIESKHRLTSLNHTGWCSSDSLHRAERASALHGAYHRQ
ncbi:putative hypothetical protein TPPCIT_018 [Candidatus Tremblaya princeps PCIT]|uniref:Uncharacterized protein n=1 Tax=Tremblaya princeps (strain PCIT) TaxID=891398 RepID=F7XYB9_TREPP|nr:putative hypothetical protein TPPCIT_018 [Candidatus Tremblaya princeps PCIT]